MDYLLIRGFHFKIFRKEKSQIGPSGGAPSKWPYFSEIHKILGNFRINNVSEVVQESIFEDDALAPEGKFYLCQNSNVVLPVENRQIAFSPIFLCRN